MALKLNHVALTVLDRERSASFYGKFFGLSERVQDDAHLLILSAPDGSLLALSEGETPPSLPRTTHFGFAAASVQEVDALRAEFKKSGIVEAGWQESGPRRVQVFDPDGYRVEAFAFK